MPGRPAYEYSSWQKVEQLLYSQGIKDLFDSDSSRFSKFSKEYVASSDPTNTFLLDYSKNLITEPILDTLLDLVREARVEEYRDKMFSGEYINTSEDRAVLNISPRGFGAYDITKAGVDEVLKHVQEFTDSVRSGAWKGYTGKTIKAIVNIDIGGSDLGPVMITEALKHYAKRDLTPYFVSNGTHLTEVLREVDPETTLFIITFTTQETITNAASARVWFLAWAKDCAHIAKYFVALSTNEKAVTSFGISKDNMFGFCDWVGGCYSLWSTISLSIALVIGYDKFEQLLTGVHDMDRHFRETPLESNLPVLLAVLGIWYSDFYGAHTHALIPYDQYLNIFMEYSQQGEGEDHVNHQPTIWDLGSHRNQRTTHILPTLAPK